MTTKKNKRKIFRKKNKPINQEEFVKAVLEILQGPYRGDEAFARQFIIDMAKIFPKALQQKALFLKAVKSLSRRNSLTVDNTWEHMRHSKDPSLDKIVTTIPMGGKN